MNDQTINALRHWITESTRTNKLPTNSKTIEARIQMILDTTAPLPAEKVVYRGQREESRRIIPVSWFSTSDDIEKVRRQHISSKADCCLFKIHLLPGVKCFAVDQVLDQYGKKPTGYNESEIIVNGGGVFYADKDLSVLGFSAPSKFKGVEIFETWYAPVAKVSLTANELFSRIPVDEYEYLNSAENLKSWGLYSKRVETVNNAVFDNVWGRIDKIKELAQQGGGRRLTRRKRGGQQNLNIRYNSVKVNGQELTTEKTARKPAVNIPAGYFLVMYDPDAVKPDWIHWIATAEKDILEYQGPSPPPGTGIHRYKFVLNSGVSPAAPPERGGQTITNYLRNPVATAEFTVKSK
jgi:hypothetical protein